MEKAGLPEKQGRNRNAGSHAARDVYTCSEASEVKGPRPFPVWHFTSKYAFSIPSAEPIISEGVPTHLLAGISDSNNN